jgi:hypothetical protein
VKQKNLIDESCSTSIPLQFGHHLLPLIQPSDGIPNHLVDNGLGALPLVDHGGSFAHQEGAGVVHGLVVNVVAEFLEVVLDGDGAFGGQFFDFSGPVLFPVLDVRVVADSERSALGLC